MSAAQHPWFRDLGRALAVDAGVIAAGRHGHLSFQTAPHARTFPVAIETPAPSPSEPTPDGLKPRRAAGRADRSVTPAHLVQLLFLGAVWGGAFLFLRIAGPEVGPVWAAEIRILIGGAILALVAGRRTWSVVRHDLRAFAVVGAAFSAIPFTLIAVATLTLPTGFAAVLNASTPLFTAVLGVMWLRQSMTIRVGAGLGLGLASVVLLVGLSPLPAGVTTLIAVAAALGAALSYAFAATFVRRRLPGVGGVEMATAQLVSGAVILLPVAIASGTPGTPSLAGLVSLVAVGTISTALPWPIFLRLLSQTTPTVASTVTFVVPAFAIAWGAIVLAEPIGSSLLVGFGLVLVSLVLVAGIRLPLPRAAVLEHVPGLRRLGYGVPGC
jgi:drug/metabolite transporter (DMT)-like permease